MDEKQPGTWEYLGDELGYEPRLGEDDPHQANRALACDLFREQFAAQLGPDVDVYAEAEKAMVMGLDAWRGKALR